MTELSTIRAEALELIKETFTAGVLRKAVFSKPDSSEEIKTELAPMMLSGSLILRKTAYMRDGKAIQKNLIADDPALSDLVLTHGQINILTTLGDAELRTSKSGKENLAGDKKIRAALRSGSATENKAEVATNDRKKNYLLSGNESFLTELGISDRNGRIHDKKQHKFRQICRFLEYVEDIYGNLPTKGKLLIYDLCCGKSYLSFAIYHYFTVIKKREVEMTGVDLKADVIAKCNAAAEAYGYTGLRFEMGDINGYKAPFDVDMVITLHACDTATDYALFNAVSWNARMIFSVPCCQHELNGQLSPKELTLFSRYGIVGERFSALATDAIRANLLEYMGYKTQLLEFIDLSHTPKNVLIRAVKRPITPKAVKARALQEVQDVMAAFEFQPTLYKLFGL